MSRVSKVIVVGGNGYVGSAICKSLVSRGFDVTVVSRSGHRPFHEEKYTETVSYAKGDALQPEQWSQMFEGADAVVSCVGCFGSNQVMIETNGTANTRLAEEAKTKFVLASFHALTNSPGTCDASSSLELTNTSTFPVELYQGTFKESRKPAMRCLGSSAIREA